MTEDDIAAVLRAATVATASDVAAFMEACYRDASAGRPSVSIVRRYEKTLGCPRGIIPDERWAQFAQARWGWSRSSFIHEALDMRACLRTQPGAE